MRAPLHTAVLIARRGRRSIREGGAASAAEWQRRISMHASGTPHGRLWEDAGNKGVISAHARGPGALAERSPQALSGEPRKAHSLSLASTLPRGH